MDKNIFETIDELLSYPKEIIQYALYMALVQGKLNFIDLNKAYVKQLEHERDDNKDKLTDANSCCLALLLKFKKETEETHADIHWALYNLNESKQFNMDLLNKRFSYNKETDCEYSSYYRDHKSN